MLRQCDGQLRVGFGGAYALDYGAVIKMAEAMGAPVDLVADVLPVFEMYRIAGLTSQASDHTPDLNEDPHGAD